MRFSTGPFSFIYVPDELHSHLNLFVLFDGLDGPLNHFYYVLGKRRVEHGSRHFLSLGHAPVQKFDDLLSLEGVFLLLVYQQPGEPTTW